MQIYPAQITKSLWVEDHVKRFLCWFQRLPFLTCLTCSPWLQILSSRSQRLAIRVFSSTPVMLTSPWPNSTASRPIFSTSIRFVCMYTHKLTQNRTNHTEMFRLGPRKARTLRFCELRICQLTLDRHCYREIRPKQIKTKLQWWNFLIIHAVFVYNFHNMQQQLL